MGYLNFEGPLLQCTDLNRHKLFKSLNKQKDNSVLSTLLTQDSMEYLY